MVILSRSVRVILAQFLSMILGNHRKRFTSSVLATHRQSILWTLRIKSHPLANKTIQYLQVRPQKMLKLQRLEGGPAVRSQNLSSLWSRLRRKPNYLRRKRSRKIWKNCKKTKRQLIKPHKPLQMLQPRWTPVRAWKSLVEKKKPKISSMVSSSLEVKQETTKIKVAFRLWPRTKKSKWQSLWKRKCKRSNTKYKIWSITST